MYQLININGFVKTYNVGGVVLPDLESGDLDLLRLTGDGDLLLLDLLYGSGDLESETDLDLDPDLK